MLPNQSFNGDWAFQFFHIQLLRALLYHICLPYYPRRQRASRTQIEKGHRENTKTFIYHHKHSTHCVQSPSANTKCQRDLSCPPPSFVSAKSARYAGKVKDIPIESTASHPSMQPTKEVSHHLLQERKGTSCWCPGMALPQEALRTGGRYSWDREHQALMGNLATENMGAPRLNKLSKEMLNKKRVLKTEILKASSPAMFSPLSFTGWQWLQTMLLSLPVFEHSPAPTSPTHPFSLLAPPTSS